MLLEKENKKELTSLDSSTLKTHPESIAELGKEMLFGGFLLPNGSLKRGGTIISKLELQRVYDLSAVSVVCGIPDITTRTSSTDSQYADFLRKIPRATELIIDALFNDAVEFIRGEDVESLR